MFSGNVRKIATVLTASDKASGKLRSAEAAGDEVADSMGRAERRARGARRGFMAAGAAVAALGGSVALLTRKFASLDQEFQTIQTTSGATADQMERLREKVQEVGIALPVTATEGAQALKQLSFSGMSASDSMAALSETAELAVASNMNLQQSAKTVAQTLNAFSLEAEQAGAVVGAMGATFASSATNIRSLTQALTQVQATANAAGLSVAETTATLGTLADAGLEASKSGTAVDSMLNRLTSSSGGTEEALDRLGLSLSDFTDQSGDLRSMPAILNTLSSEMEDVGSQAERIQLAQELFGKQGARAALPLLRRTDKLQEKIEGNLRAEIQGAIGDLAEMNEQDLSRVSELLGVQASGETSTKELVTNLRELSEQGESTAQVASRLAVGLNLTDQAAQALASDITDTNKSIESVTDGIGGVVTAQQLAEEQTQTLSGQIQQLRSTLQILGFQIFTGTKPAVSALVSSLRALADPLSSNETLVRGLGAALVALTGAAAAATAAFGAAYIQATVIPTLLTSISGSFLTAAAGAGSLTGALGVLAGAVASVAWPILVIVAAIGVLVAGFMMLKEVIEKDILGVGSDLAVLMERIGAVVNFLKPTVKPLIGIFVELGKILLAVAVAPLVLEIMAIIKGLKLLSDIVVWTIDAIMGLVNGTKTLEGVLGDAAGNIVSFFSGIGGAIVGAVSSIDWGGIAWTIVEALAMGLGAALGLWIKGWQMYLGFLVDFWTTVPGIVLDALMALPGLLWNGLKAGFGLWVKGWQMYLSFLWDFWTSIPSLALEAGRRIVPALIKGLKATAPNVSEGIEAVVDVIASFLPWSNAERGPLSNIMSVGGNIVSALASGLRNGVGLVAGAADAVAGAVAGVFDDLASGAAERGQALISTVAEGAKSAGGAVKSAVEGAADKASSVLPFSDADEGPFKNLTERGAALVSTVAKGVEGEDSTLQDTLAGVAEGTPLGQAASTLVGAIGGSGGPAAALGDGPAAGGSGRPIEIVLEQTNNFDGAGSREEIRRMVEEATRSGGEDALAELELLLKHTLSEA
jgi:TP901 family phage tail tape measure protein